MNQIENQLFDIWKEVLEIDSFSIEDNFFELGGTSANIILLNDLISTKYPDKIKITDIFSNPTIKNLSILISQRTGQDNINKETFKF